MKNAIFVSLLLSFTLISCYGDLFEPTDSKTSNLTPTDIGPGENSVPIEPPSPAAIPIPTLPPQSSPIPTPTPQPTDTPTPTPIPTPPTTPSGGTLNIGDKVKVIGGPALAYNTPSTSGTVVGGHHNSATGVIVNGLVDANHANWWKIDFDIDVDQWTGKVTDGWVQESFLTQSPPIQDTVAPYIQVTPPTGIVTGAVTFSAPAQEPVVNGEVVSGVAGVRFIVDGQFVGPEDTTEPYEITWDSTALANGYHILTAISRDQAQNTRRAPPIVIKIQNASAATETYYLASGVDAQGNATTVVGNDANDGLHPTQIAPGQGPWQSVARAQAKIDGGLQTGTSFRFRRGDAFNGFIKLSQTRNITFSSYYNFNGSDDPNQPRPLIQHDGSQSIFRFCCGGPNNWNLLIENLQLLTTKLAVAGGGIEIFSNPNTIGTYTLRNLEIAGGNRAVSNGAKGRFILENSILHDTWTSPLWASVPQDSVIRNNTFYECGLRPTGLKEHCIYASGGAPDSYNLLIEGNHLTSSQISPGVIIVSRVKEGIHIRNNQTFSNYNGDYGMYFGGWNDNDNPNSRPQQHLRDIEVSGNFISGRAQGLELSAVSDARVFNNVFYNQMGHISFTITYGISPSSHIRFFNNSIHNSDGNQTGHPAIRVVGWSRGKHVDIANNIISTRRQKIFQYWQNDATNIEPTVRLRNNLYFFPNLSLAQSDLAKPYIFQNPQIQPIRFTLSEFQSLYNQEENSQYSDPVFLNEAAPLGADNQIGTDDDGLRLSAASLAAMDAGESFDLLGMGLWDILGTLRPQGANWDIGAYEY